MVQKVKHKCVLESLEAHPKIVFYFIHILQSKIESLSTWTL
uniref:Uncharacterized protein n=1 Tax=Arundo donax TaxID=35708 RepID=A0A0A8YHU4_ARUDO